MQAFHTGNDSRVREPKVAMLVATDSEGHKRARPLTIVGSEPHAGHDELGLWPPRRITFATHRRNPVLSIIATNGDVCVTLQDGAMYVCLMGNASASEERSRIRALWSNQWRAWFGGTDDPDIVLIDFDLTFAEYWDVSGAVGLRYLLDAGRRVEIGSSMLP